MRSIPSPGDKSDSVLWVYTIYYQDYLPYPYRMRAFAVAGGETVPGPEIGAALNLDAARQMLPRSADARFPRQEGDDPEIVESWM